jgi:hypothetical protein
VPERTRIIGSRRRCTKLLIVLRMRFCCGLRDVLHLVDVQHPLVLRLEPAPDFLPDQVLLPVALDRIPQLRKKRTPELHKGAGRRCGNRKEPTPEFVVAFTE